MNKWKKHKTLITKSLDEIVSNLASSEQRDRLIINKFLLYSNTVPKPRDNQKFLKQIRITKKG